MKADVMNLFIKARLRNALLLGLSLSVAACEAQKPTSTAASTPSATSAATPTPPLKAPQFSEPAVTGKIIDAQTKLPIQGALIYGFYATRGGGTLAGGSKFGEHVKSFETETDANGIFTSARPSK